MYLKTDNDERPQLFKRFHNFIPAFYLFSINLKIINELKEIVFPRPKS